MTDRPILFSAPMVRALLDGRKTQTRRVIKPTKKPLAEGQLLIRWGAQFGGQCERFELPYAIGDRLYVKEAWRTWKDLDHLPPIETLIHEAPIFYELDRDNCDRHGRYRSARFMMRHMSRLTLTVTDVRVQRLQDISEADAIAEGCLYQASTDHGPLINCYGPDCPVQSAMSCNLHGCWGIREQFADLWNSINGPDAWAANPWVVALTFDVHRCNIDTLKGNPQ